MQTVARRNCPQRFFLFFNFKFYCMANKTKVVYGYLVEQKRAHPTTGKDYYERYIELLQGGAKMKISATDFKKAVKSMPDGSGVVYASPSSYRVVYILSI